jgi:hypothetical protein
MGSTFSYKFDLILPYDKKQNMPHTFKHLNYL